MSIGDEQNREGQFFGLEGIEAFLESTETSTDSSDLVGRLFDALDTFRHGEPEDDVLAIVVSFP